MKSANLLKILTIFFTIISLASCSSYKPILYQNQTYLENGKEVADKEVERCNSEAKEYLKQFKARRAAKEAGRNAVIGGVIGTASGAIFGRTLKSTLIGTAIGAGFGAAMGALSVAGEDKVKPDQMKQRFVARCLSQKGYEVLGWE
ncbi:MAG: cell envelope biogenesis protein OmpA [Proteobacteria bacterium]|nr:cell envelope biogenesis protein OmpA [Pseudomonadota bacterium]